MTVDRELRPELGTVVAGGDGASGRADPDEGPDRLAGPAEGPDPVSRATIFWYSAVAAILLSWFFYGWLVLKQGFIASVGEAVGSGFGLLLAVSVVGTVRRIRADRLAAPGHGAVSRRERPR